jgi:hypothetical protein
MAVIMLLIALWRPINDIPHTYLADDENPAQHALKLLLRSLPVPKYYKNQAREIVSRTKSPLAKKINYDFTKFNKLTGDAP